MSFINLTDLGGYIEIAKQDFHKNFGDGELVLELEVINGQEMIILNNGKVKVYYAFKPLLKELEVVSVINIEGIQ